MRFGSPTPDCTVSRRLRNSGSQVVSLVPAPPGANVGAGAIFGLGLLASLIGIGLGIFGAVTRSGARGTYVLAAAAIAAVAVGVFVVGSAQYA